QLRDRADPLQPTPAMLGSMHAENQQQILRSKGPDRRAGQGDRLQSFPQTVEILREREVSGCDSPVQLHNDLAVLAQKFILVLGSKIGCLLGLGQMNRRPVALSEQKVFRVQRVSFTNQDI